MRLGLALAIILTGSVSAADWPQWRGPQGNGATDEKNLPVKWSATENVAWKAAIGGLGVSSPIVSGDRVFVTSQIGTGVRRPGNHPRLAQGANAGVAGERALGAPRAAQAAADDRTFFVVEAFNRADGRRLWQHRIEAAGPLPGVHDKHNLASPSPVTDGQMVYAWFGTGQIVALDMNGKVVWERHLGQEIAPFDINWGHAQLADALRRHAAPAVRSRAGVLPARGRQEDGQGALEGRSRQGPDVVHHAVRRRDRRPARS